MMIFLNTMIDQLGIISHTLNTIIIIMKFGNYYHAGISSASCGSSPAHSQGMFSASTSFAIACPICLPTSVTTVMNWPPQARWWQTHQDGKSLCLQRHRRHRICQPVRQAIPWLLARLDHRNGGFLQRLMYGSCYDVSRFIKGLYFRLLFLMVLNSRKNV